MTALTIENINAYFAIKTTSPFVDGYGLPLADLISEEVEARRKLFPGGDEERYQFECELQGAFYRREVKLTPQQQIWLGLLGDDPGFGEGGEG